MKYVRRENREIVPSYFVGESFSAFDATLREGIVLAWARRDDHSIGDFENRLASRHREKRGVAL